MRTVLFLCVHNAGRSQMAAALAERASRGRIRVLTGGSEPAEAVHPEVLRAMSEIGADLSAARPRAFTGGDVREADVVVTMGCGDACPVLPGKRYEDWELPDPAGKPIEEVREIRDDLARRVERLVAELAAEPTP